MKINSFEVTDRGQHGEVTVTLSLWDEIGEEPKEIENREASPARPGKVHLLPES